MLTPIMTLVALATAQGPITNSTIDNSLCVAKMEADALKGSLRQLYAEQNQVPNDFENINLRIGYRTEGHELHKRIERNNRKIAQACESGDGISGFRDQIAIRRLHYKYTDYTTEVPLTVQSFKPTFDDCPQAKKALCPSKKHMKMAALARQKQITKHWQKRVNAWR